MVIPENIQEDRQIAAHQDNGYLGMDVWDKGQRRGIKRGCEMEWTDNSTPPDPSPFFGALFCKR